MKREYWVKNRSSSELISSELALKVPLGKPVNLFDLNPDLTHEMLAESEEKGFLHRCFSPEHGSPKLVKIIEVVARPEIKKNQITEAKTFMPTRRRSSIVVDPKEHSYIDELASFDEAMAAGYDEEGFADPMKVAGQSGERFGEAGKPFSAVVVPQKPGQDRQTDPGQPLKISPKRQNDGGILVDAD